MTYQYTNFGTQDEKIKTRSLESDDVKELYSVLEKYVSRFLTKEKGSETWMYFHAEVQDQTKRSYDLCRTVCKISLDREEEV